MSETVSNKIVKAQACQVVDLCGSSGTLIAVIMTILYAIAKKEGPKASSIIMSACANAISGDIHSSLEKTNDAVLIINSNKEG